MVSPPSGADTILLHLQESKNIPALHLRLMVRIHRWRFFRLQSRPQTTRYWTCAQESQHQCSTHWAIGQHPRNAWIWEHIALIVLENKCLRQHWLLFRELSSTNHIAFLHSMIFDQIHKIKNNTPGGKPCRISLLLIEVFFKD